MHQWIVDNQPEPSTSTLIHFSFLHIFTSNSSQLKSKVNNSANWFSMLYADTPEKEEGHCCSFLSLPLQSVSDFCLVFVPLWLTLCNFIILLLCHCMEHAYCTSPLLLFMIWVSKHDISSPPTWSTFFEFQFTDSCLEMFPVLLACITHNSRWQAVLVQKQQSCKWWWCSHSVW